MSDETILGAAPTTSNAAPTAGTDPAAAGTPNPGADAGQATQQPNPAGTAVDGQQPAGGETKPDDKAKAEGETKEGDDKKPDADKPIEYAEFTLPDGVQADKEALDQFVAISREAKIPQDVAQKYVDLYASKVKTALEAPGKAWAEITAGWTKEINEDPEYGGDKLPASIKAAARAIDRFGTPGLREALNITGAGNNPAVLRFFASVGKAISEDGPIAGAAAPAPKSTAQVLYPTMAKE
jgi:hypothetical protein